MGNSWVFFLFPIIEEVYSGKFGHLIYPLFTRRANLSKRFSNSDFFRDDGSGGRHAQFIGPNAGFPEYPIAEFCNQSSKKGCCGKKSCELNTTSSPNEPRVP